MVRPDAECKPIDVKIIDVNFLAPSLGPAIITLMERLFDGLNMDEMVEVAFHRMTTVSRARDNAHATRNHILRNRGGRTMEGLLPRLCF